VLSFEYVTQTISPFASSRLAIKATSKMNLTGVWRMQGGYSSFAGQIRYEYEMALDESIGGWINGHVEGRFYSCVVVVIVVVVVVVCLSSLTTIYRVFPCRALAIFGSRTAVWLFPPISANSCRMDEFLLRGIECCQTG